jgi:peptide/nickel transport system substrate-binding protein
LRKAIASIVPYGVIFQAAAYGRGAPLWGATESISDTAWPRKSPYATDLEAETALLAASACPEGFETTLSISTDLASWMEPAALLIQEAVGKLGITVELEKIPGATWRTAALVEKRLPIHLEIFGGWLNTPDSHFFRADQKHHLFNSSNYFNEEVGQLSDETLHMAMDDPVYAPKIQRMCEIAFEDLPRIPLCQPALNVAVNGAAGYEFRFHRQLDIRSLAPAGA